MPVIERIRKVGIGILSRTEKVLKSNIFSSKISLFIAIFLIKGLYDFLSIRYLVDLYYPSVYRGYNINPNQEKMIVGIAVFLAFTIVFLLIRKHSRSLFSKTVLTVLFVIYFLPMNSAFYLNDADYTFLVSSHTYLLFLFCLVLFADNYLLKKKKKSTEIQETTNNLSLFILSIVSVLICLALIIYKLSVNGLQFLTTIDPDSVYAQRDFYNEYVSEISGTPVSYFVYTIKHLSGTAAVFLIIYALSHRKILFGIVGIITVLSNYSLSAGKSSVLFLLIIAVVVLISKLNLANRYGEFVIWGILLVLLASIISRSVFYVLIRRLMYAPAWLNGIYHQFFSNHPVMFWTQEAVPFKWIFTDILGTPNLELISKEYFLGQMRSPNTGLFAEAFKHFGYYGVLIYPILLSLMLKWFSFAFESLGEGIALVFATRLSITLTNVPITRNDFVIGVTLFAALISMIRLLLKNQYIITKMLKLSSWYDSHITKKERNVKV